MRLTALLLIAFLLVGCGKKVLTPVHYGAQIQPILNDRCISCHGNERAEGKIVLTSFESLMASRVMPGKKPLVVPGDYAKSWLYILCATDQPHYRMPPDTMSITPLPKADLELLANWIAQGAHND